MAGIANGFQACDVVVKERPTQLPPPIGIEPYPYVGCSEDPRHQLPEVRVTESVKKVVAGSKGNHVVASQHSGSWGKV